MRGIAAGRGANAPANAPIIGSPRLISSSLELPSDNLPGRPRTHDTNEQADEHEYANERASPATDDALEEQRIIEIFRRIRLLSDDRRFLHLSANAWNHRAHLLDWYREGGFLKDLADGRHDGYAEALGNQGKSYFPSS